MNSQDAIQEHRFICDELYELTLEETRFMQQHRRVPEAGLLIRKRSALQRLDEALIRLRSASSDAVNDPARRVALQKTQARIIQILQIDRENEQLLMRFSLSRSAPVPPPAPAPAPMLLSRMYGSPC